MLFDLQNIKLSAEAAVAMPVDNCPPDNTELRVVAPGIINSPPVPVAIS